MDVNSIAPLEAKGKYALLLDFDLCLVNRHLAGEVNKDIFYEFQPNKEDFDFSKPKEKLNKLLREFPELVIYIASFGYSKQINKVKHWLINEELRERFDVLTPKSFGEEEGTSKVRKKKMFMKIKEDTKGISNN